MSREVEVTGLNMTATVPEDLQISLGAICKTAGTTAAVESDAVSLAASSGFLTWDTGKSNADNGTVKAPTTNAWDWSNSADISAYYSFGRLIPASSTTGENIFYTPDASGVGKTVKANASYYLANDKLFARGTDSVASVTADAASATNTRATLHAYTSADDKTDPTTGDATSWKKKSYVQAADWKTTNDDGYYVDVPVWIRTSSNADVKLSVDGYILPGSDWVDGGTTKKKQTDLELYRAVRVAILNGDDTNASGTAAASGSTFVGTPVNTANIIPLKDAWVTTATDTTSTVKAIGSATDTTEYTAITAANMPFSSTLDSILDSLNLKDRTTEGIASYDTNKFYGVTSAETTKTSFNTGDDYYKGTYSEYTALTPTSAGSTATTVATVKGSGTDAQYGDMKKLIIRVWLDGEDGECWNDNAGQDWAISLKFSKLETTTSTGG